MTITRTHLVTLGLALVAIGCDQLVRAADPVAPGSGLVRAKGPASDRGALRPFRSIFELLKVIGQLAVPRLYDERAEDAFEFVLPSLPGGGFSGKPQGTGWNPDRVAR